MTSNYLHPVDDGLATRQSNTYVRTKLKAIQVYLNIVSTAMKAKWPELIYLDLQAGPGKNRIGKKEILLGSPLIALTLQNPFTRYYFNEKDPFLASALKERIKASSHADKVTVYEQDVNQAVESICKDIKKYENKALNVAFLDPEGLEVHWSSVEKLARFKRMDLIITFSTSGVLRSAGKNFENAINSFYGNNDWIEDISMSDRRKKRRALINRYLSQLKKFGYHIDENPTGLEEYHDISFKNTRGAEVYSLIFASKNRLGNKFWGESGKSAKQPKLPGL